MTYSICAPFLYFLRNHIPTRNQIRKLKIANYDENISSMQRFNPSISDEAETILNEYYIGIARTVDSPSLRGYII